MNAIADHPQDECAFQECMETAEILCDAEMMEALRISAIQVAHGDVITWDNVKKELFMIDTKPCNYNDELAIRR